MARAAGSLVVCEHAHEPTLTGPQCSGLRAPWHGMYCTPMHPCLLSTGGARAAVEAALVSSGCSPAAVTFKGLRHKRPTAPCPNAAAHFSIPCRRTQKSQEVGQELTAGSSPSGWVGAGGSSPPACPSPGPTAASVLPFPCPRCPCCACCSSGGAIQEETEEMKSEGEVDSMASQSVW